jgi:small subunit ribosomal protein S20
MDCRENYKSSIPYQFAPLYKSRLPLYSKQSTKNNKSKLRGISFMPIIKSAKKRVRVAEKAAIRNSKTKRSLKAALKAFRAKTTGDNQAEAQSMLDKAAKKGLIHKNKAARQKAQLARAAKAAGTKPAAAPAKKSTGAKKVKSPVAAPAKKTTAAKKATTAKAAPAKAATKKPAAKK